MSTGSVSKALHCWGSNKLNIAVEAAISFKLHDLVCGNDIDSAVCP
jgi:hypothetical protein